MLTNLMFTRYLSGVDGDSPELRALAFAANERLNHLGEEL